LAARSSALLLALAGCDVVFQLDTEVRACESSPIDPATATDLAPAELASIDAAQQFAIVRDPTLMLRQIDLASGEATAEGLELGAYNALSLALVPEGDALFFTAAIEPPVLQGAVRDGDGWRTANDLLPTGTAAGTPSARAFGARRLLVRLVRDAADVQEFEEVEGRWRPVGSPLAMLGTDGPNLTPNGLTAVFTARSPIVGEDGEVTAAGIYLTSRAGIDAPFGPPSLILEGGYNSPQLLDQCKHLYAVDDATFTLRRFAR
jgi:hypothetical protein